MSERIVTAEELRDLARLGKIKPEDIFERYDLADWARREKALEKVREEEAAELKAAEAARAEAAAKAAKGETKDGGGEEDIGKYIDPARNPFILGGEAAAKAKAEPEIDPALDPARNPYIKL